VRTDSVMVFSDVSDEVYVSSHYFLELKITVRLQCSSVSLWPFIIGSRPLRPGRSDTSPLNSMIDL
jgi:hypothetical protein